MFLYLYLSIVIVMTHNMLDRTFIIPLKVIALS